MHALAHCNEFAAKLPKTNNGKHAFNFFCKNKPQIHGPAKCTETRQEQKYKKTTLLQKMVEKKKEDYSTSVAY